MAEVVDVRTLPPAARPRPGVSGLPRTSVIVPAYNEEGGLALVLDRLFAVLDPGDEVIVVDDGSVDRTAAVAAGYPCRLLRHAGNRGKGVAVRTGIAAARGAIVVVVDADDTYPIEALPRLVAGLETHQFVSGSRRGRDAIPAINRVGNAVLRQAIRCLYGSTVEDPLTGFYAARKSVFQQMRLSSTGFGIESEIVIKAARMGLPVFNFPVSYERREGTSKLHPLKDGSRIFRTVLGYLALYNPTLAFILPGVLLSVLGLAVMTLLMRGPIPVGQVSLSGNTMIVAATLALLGAQLTVFGLAANLYACRHWMAARDRITDLLLHRHARAVLLAAGWVLILEGVVWGARLVRHWSRSGFAHFTRTGEAVFVSFLLVVGVQLLFSVSFLGLFMGAFQEEDAAGGSAEEVLRPPA